MELNKICFVIFRFFYKLLRIYQFLADFKNKKKVNLRFCIGNLRKAFIVLSLFHPTDSGRVDWVDGFASGHMYKRSLGSLKNFYFFSLFH